MYAIDGSGLFTSALLGLSAITCATLAVARRQQPARRCGAEPAASTPPPAFSLRRAPFVSGVLDVAEEARDVLQQMAAEAAGHMVQLEFAVQPDLSVHADRLALRAVLSELVGNAMRHAPCGRVLLSAIRLGGRVQIAVTDDGATPDAASQQAALRDISELVALQGGTIDVEVYPGEGTTVVVRLPESTVASRAPGEASARPTQDCSAASPRPAREALAEASWDI
jgi:two-component system sensor histidine kinase NreB